MTAPKNDPQFLEFALQYLTDERRELLESVVKMRTRRVTVVLEDIFRSHNAGAVLRSCDCFGIQDVHIIENRNTWNHHPDIEQGSSKWLSIKRYNDEPQNTAACLTALREKGYLIAATTPRSENSIDDVPVDKPVALVFGTEMKGISDKVIEMADMTCRIPMFGFTESFNISVAAAVSLHAMRRKLKEAGVPWELTDDERTGLLLEWCGKVLKHFEHYEKAYAEKKLNP